jgi:hypothetical protein
MPLFPAVSMGSGIVGLDIHAQIIPPAPAPIPTPEPYAGVIFLWLTPQFPKVNVFVNSTPACAVGAMGYSTHIPFGVPVLPTNPSYWGRYLTHVAMGLTLAGLTIFANMAIAALSALLPLPKAAEDFVKDVTGIDTTDSMTFCNTTMAAFASFTQWQTWVKLLMPPMPFPGAQGSQAVGSPNVTINGGAMAFVCPLAAASCSDIPVVPNACTIGFSNVMVGISMGALVRAMAVTAAQAGVQAGLSKGVEKMTAPPEGQPEGKKDCGC